jgi:hypothetical protein
MKAMVKAVNPLQSVVGLCGVWCVVCVCVER